MPYQLFVDTLISAPTLLATMWFATLFGGPIPIPPLSAFLKKEKP
jgi:hypothetical protein